MMSFLSSDWTLTDTTGLQEKLYLILKATDKMVFQKVIRSFQIGEHAEVLREW